MNYIRGPGLAQPTRGESKNVDYGPDSGTTSIIAAIRTLPAAIVPFAFERDIHKNFYSRVQIKRHSISRDLLVW